MTKRRKRSLAAVWFADVTGFTALTGQDEDAALTVVEELKQCSRRAVTGWNGRIVKFLGDGVLASFESVDGGVRAAHELLRDFAASPTAREHGCRLRIGMHLGEIVHQPDGDVYGDGVNLASRIQALADPGQLLVSASVHQQIRHRQDFETRSVGERSLKGVSESTELFAVDPLEGAGDESSGPPASVEARIGAELGSRYRLIREIGRGGMATVYLAEDLRHDREVALKVLDPDLGRALGAERFLTEIRTTANLQHPHILPLFDSGEAGDLLFYVMPYVDGESLRSRLEREGMLPVDDAVRIATQLADALDYAHRQGVVHRDLKPGNVLVHDGQPLLMDFGIALAVDAAGGDRLTRSGQSVGTPRYMSPEQATGDERVGPATDLWALGCVLYEMLVGEPPHAGETVQAVVGRILTGTAEPMTTRRRSVPAHVDAAVLRALEKVPADRFPSARAFGEALGDPSFTHAGFGTGRTGKEGRRSGGRKGRGRTSTWAAVAGWTATLVLLATLAWSSGSTGADAPVVRHFSVLLPPGTDVAPSGVTQPLAMSRDGTRLVYVAIDQEEDRSQLWTRSLADRQWVSVPGTEGAGSVILSPDGRSVAFNHPETGEIRRIGVAGGGSATLTELGSVAYHGGVWGRDGTLVFAVSGGLRRVAETGGSPEKLTEVDPAEGLLHRLPAFLPDDSGIVFTISPRDANDFPDLQRIAVLPFGGSVKPLLEGHSPYVTEDGLLLFSRGRTGELWVVRMSDDFTEPRYRILVYDLEGRTLTPITLDVNADWPVWTPDGERLVFNRFSSERPDEQDMYVVRADGAGDPEPLIPPDPYQRHAQEFSPDGRFLVFHHSEYTRAGDTDIWALPMDGGEPRPVVATPAIEIHPTISPDGRWLAYRSNESGQAEIYVTGFPESRTRWKVSNGGSRAPATAPPIPGYSDMSRNDSGMVSVPLTTDSTLSAGEPRVHFDGPFFGALRFARGHDVGADGERFLMTRVRPAEPIPPRIVVVQNWLDQARARLERGGSP